MTMRRLTVHSSTGGPFTFMCNRLLQSIWHVRENINVQKIQILYVPQYSEKKKMYYEMNKICKCKASCVKRKCLLYIWKYRKRINKTCIIITSLFINQYRIHVYLQIHLESKDPINQGLGTDTREIQLSVGAKE